ncbi:MAG: zinc-ribbon domain-containing protein [Pyrinomonadaceae bacterium]
MSSDQTMTCVDCTAEFNWSAREQEFYAEKGFSAPKRCKPCKEARKAQRGDTGGGGSSSGVSKARAELKW